MSVQKITTCLWFDTEAEAAAKQYTSIFPNSQITHRTYFSTTNESIHQKPPGSIMTIEFHLNNHPFVALNGGPQFSHNEAISFQIECADQAEVDYYWEKLGEGGDEKRRECGWLADRWGVAWQVLPKCLGEWMRGEDGARKERVLERMMGMEGGKMDVRRLREAWEGEEKVNNDAPKEEK